MCLSDIGRVIESDHASYGALVDVDGRRVRVSTITLGQDEPGPEPGDWLVVHTGLAVERLSAAEAETIRRARAELHSATPPPIPSSPATGDVAAVRARSSSPRTSSPRTSSPRTSSKERP